MNKMLTINVMEQYYDQKIKTVFVPGRESKAIVFRFYLNFLNLPLILNLPLYLRSYYT